MIAAEEHHRRLERMYLQARINRQHFPSTTIQIGEEQTVVTLEVGSSYHHALGGAHGLVYFKLMDDSAYFSAQSGVRDAFLYTTQFDVHLVRPITTGRVTATGKLRFASRELWIAESRVLDAHGKEVGFGTGHFARSRQALTPEIGYV